ncbi:MAG: TetR family transcriptional regulator [Calditrichales bacterium]|nr:TetR family transcriptional regulator [Calditrichales bacterium]
MKKQSPKKLQRKTEIVEAAVKVFAEKGFFKAKVSDVAKEAGIADGTVYLYFKNKEDLLIYLFENKIGHILMRFNSQLSEIIDPIEKMKLFFQIYFKIIKEDKKLAEVFQVELRQSAKFLKNYHNQKFIDFLNIIGDILIQGKQDGFFNPELNTNVTKILIFGALDETARQWILGADSKYSLKEAVDHISSILITGLLIV